MTATVHSKTIRPLVAGNWKMNGVAASLAEARKLATGLMWGATPGAGAAADPGCDVMLCPPATLVAALVSATAGTGVAVGGQDCHANRSGAHTGDVSAEMLADAGATAVIVGHSERRADHAEGDATVRAKAEAAYRAGLVAIVCVGETADQRKAGQTLAVVGAQVQGSMPDTATAATTVVAYEPVWAIGTGKTATAEQAQETHAFIRRTLGGISDETTADKIRIQYGGSVKPDNVRILMTQPDIDGALVGGASLDPRSFVQLVQGAAAEGRG